MFTRAFAVIAVALGVTAPANADDQPLKALAQMVPEDAQGWVSLANIAAAKEQARPFADPPTEVNLGLMAFAPVNPMLGFEVQSLGASQDLFKSVLGFSVGDISGLATWGNPPDGPAIMTFDKPIRPSTIGPALTKRGYVVDSRDGVPVWHRQEDHKFDVERVREDPFTGGLGLSGRFALTKDALIFARAWPMLDRVLAVENSYGDRPEVGAILDAVHKREGLGDLIEVLFVGPQGGRMADVAAALGTSLTENPTDRLKAVLEKLDYPGLPPFLNHALVLWQDRARMTGAIAIPYADEPTARDALKRFLNVLKVAPSLSVNRPMAEVLPEERTFTVVSSGDHAVLLLMFHQQADERNLGSVLAFRDNPVKKFTQMIMVREWSVLTGYHQ